MWEKFGMTVNPSAFLASKSGSSCSCCPVRGAPLPRVRPTHCSRPLRSRASQVSTSMCMRRSTRLVPPSGIQTNRSKSGVPGTRLDVPSTCPKRLRMVVPAASDPRARRKPAWDQRTEANARVSFRSIRSAWATVTWSSEAMCRSKSPPLHARSSRSIPNFGNGFSQSGTCPVAAWMKCWPNPKVTLNRAGTWPSSGSVSANAFWPWVRRAASSVSNRIMLWSARESTSW